MLVFAGIPAAVVLLVYALVYGAAGRRSSKRYRPGRPFTFAPVWFLASSREATEVARMTEAEAHPVTAGGIRPPLPPAATAADGERIATAYGETGGASDRW
ncbi:MAG: hypothetical protein J2P15_09640 [Micromonosporaceae bacterium]|nr:hypothetical protein [Micromonosporaceae bacterium]